MPTLLPLPSFLTGLRWILALLLLAGFFNQASATPVKFDIPAQSGAAALNAFSKQAGVEVLFPYEELKKIRANPVAGSFEPEQALLRLLQGTGFSISRPAPGKYVVAMEPPRPVKDRAPRPGATGPGASLPGKAGTGTPGTLQLDKVVVTPSRFGVSDEQSIATATFTHENIENLPQLGEDVFRATARMPGLATHDFSAKFWVRGAPNDQVLTRLDGVDLLEPYHLKDLDGVFSIIDIETVAKLDLLTGGFTVDYGDRLAGVLSMETERPTGEQSHTTLGLSLTGIRATNRGTFAGGRGDWVVSGRSGYLDAALKTQDVNGEVIPRYYDLFAKVELAVAPNQVLSLQALHSGDTMTWQESDQPKLTSRYGSDYLWARWRGTFGDALQGEAVLSRAHLTWHREGSGYFNQLLGFSLLDDRSLDLTTLRQDWSLGLSERALLRAGFELQAASADYVYHRVRELSVLNNGVVSVQRRTRDITIDPEGDSTGAYAALRYQPRPALTLEAGLRFDRQDYAAGSNWSPRFNATYDVGRTTVRAAWGIYRQAPGLHQLAVQDGATSFFPAERAEHRVLGVEHHWRNGLGLRAELYERLAYHPSPRWENVLDPYEIFPEVQADRYLLTPSRGRAQGFELIAENRTDARWHWSASYVLAKAEETINGRTVPRARDQRHTFYLDLNFKPSPRWQFSAAWQYHSGWPTTDQFFSLEPLATGGTVVTYSLGPAYALRLPAYHRLDLRATRRFQLKHATIRAFVDVFNAYDHGNIGKYDAELVLQNGQVTTQRLPQKLITLLPTAGVIWDF